MVDLGAVGVGEGCPHHSPALLVPHAEQPSTPSPHTHAVPGIRLCPALPPIHALPHPSVPQPPQGKQVNFMSAVLQQGDFTSVHGRSCGISCAHRTCNRRQIEPGPIQLKACGTECSLHCILASLRVPNRKLWFHKTALMLLPVRAGPCAHGDRTCEISTCSL